MACVWRMPKSDAEEKQHAEIAEVRQRRKAVLRTFQGKCPEQPMEWRDGRLVFAKNGAAVPGSPIIAKPKIEQPAESLPMDRSDRHPREPLFDRYRFDRPGFLKTRTNFKHQTPDI